MKNAETITYQRYTVRVSLPMWNGGGVQKVTRYKSEVERKIIGLDCKLRYRSKDGENIDSVVINVKSLYCDERVQSEEEINAAVTQMWLRHVTEGATYTQYSEKYEAAKAKHEDPLNIFLVAMDISQRCEQYFSARIWEEFGVVMA